jgi:hypothetical protein
MLRSIEAMIDTNGRITLKEPLRLSRSHRAIVTILDDVGEDELNSVNEAALLSEPALVVDWNRTEEDEAWSHLQQER